VVEDAPRGVARVRPQRNLLQRLAQGDSRAAGVVRILGEDHPAEGGVRTRAGDHPAAPVLHADAAVRLVNVAGPDHVNLAFEPKRALAKQRALPHSPEAVSVTSRRIPSWRLNQAWATAVFGLGLPSG